MNPFEGFILLISEKVESLALSAASFLSRDIEKPASVIRPRLIAWARESFVFMVLLTRAF
jgi:hypothetical protein